MGHSYSNKNLTELKIVNIEYYLNNKLCPAEIDLKLNRNPLGIRKKIKNYSLYFGETRKYSNYLN